MIKRERSLREHSIGLSAREVETLTYLAYGLSLNEVAIKMAVKPNTVATYKTRIFNKLGVNSTAEALVIGAAIVFGAEIHITQNCRLKVA